MIETAVTVFVLAFGAIVAVLTTAILFAWILDLCGVDDDY